MVERLSLEIITPERVVVRDEVDMVEGKGALGEFGILPGHARFLTILNIGEVRYTKDGVTQHLAASGGFGEVAQDKVTFLLDTAELAQEIDVERARQAVERAEAALRELSLDGNEYLRHELALHRAITRIQAASKRL